LPTAFDVEAVDKGVGEGAFQADPLRTCIAGE